MKDLEEVISFFEGMHMTKEFREDKNVSKEDMLAILEVGRLSPSSFGLEPWKFLVIENDYIKSHILRLSKGIEKISNLGSYVVIILSRTINSLNYNSDYVRYIMEDIQNIPPEKINKRLDSYKIFLEDDFDILSDPKNIECWSMRQAYIPMTNMVIAAHKLGIDSCAIEGFHRKKLEVFLSHEKILNRKKYSIACLLVFGYNNGQQREKKRREFKEVVEWIK